MADGSVEIRITGSVDPSIAASANEAKAAVAGIGETTTISAAQMAAALAATGGNLKKITPDMVGLGTTAKSAAAGQEALAGASAVATAATEANTVATEANAAVHINSRAAYEGTVLIHELLQGRYSRLTGSSLILTQQLAGQAAVSKLVTSAMSAQGAAVLGTAAALVALIGATISYDRAQEHLNATVVGLGAASGITAQQLDEVGSHARSASQSISETTKAAAAFSAAGVRNKADIDALSNSLEAYSQMTGTKFADAQKTLAEAMRDPVKGAQDLHDQLGILDGDQIEQIQRLTELGDKDQAVTILVQAYTQRIKEAQGAGVGFASGLGAIVNGLSNMWTWLGNVNERISESIPLFGRWRVEANEAQAAQAQVIQNQAKLNEVSAKGAAAFNATPEGQAAAKRAELQGQLNAAKDALAVDTATHGAHSDAVKRDQQAIADYSHAVGTYLTEVEKKTRADQLDVKIAEAKHAHNKQLVADLTEQKALLTEAGKIESDSDAKALAKGAGDVAGARTGAGHTAKGPSIVSEWEEQLHQAEVASGEFFKDQTADELAFWQGKVALTKTGSKEWLDVQSKIYDAQKTLAHQSYDEHLADLNDRIEADRGDFKKVQADWAEKLAFIKAKNGEESTAYKDAHRQMESEERQHQQQMIQAELSGNSKEIEALKQHLSALRQIRETDAQSAEALIKEQADSSPFGDVGAAIRVGELHHQLASQEIADAQAVYDKEEALRQQGLADALKADGVESAAYKQALIEDKNAFQAFQDQVAQLQAKSTARQIQDILALKQAYTNYVSGTVNAAVTGLDGMLSRTENWKQALIGVYQSLVQTFESSIAKMATKWVVEHVFMTAAQRAQLAVQTAAHTASEVAKTAATTTGVATRAGVENTGFFARLLGLLGISVGAHSGTEAAKTGATVAGVATRTTAETTGATTSLATQTATNVALAASYSGVAGAAGVASWAAAPWPIDAGAPSFGASMAAAAAGYGSLAALATGTNYLPNDMVAQIHEGERIIPKADNAKLIQMMGIAASGGTDGGGRGDVHLHYSPNVHQREPNDLRQMLASGGGAMIDFLEKSARDGKLNDFKKKLAA